MGSSVVFRLTESGGPDPLNELERVAVVAEESRDGTSWIASRKPGAAFKADSSSQLLAFALVSKTEALALTSRIVDRHDQLPTDSLVRDMYESYEGKFGAYWKIRDVHLTRTPFEELPGTTLRGKSIGEAFRSRLTFAYWKPDQLAKAEGNVNRRRRLARASLNVLTSAVASMTRVGKPHLPIHGVDFSGARENDGRNGKIWIASWWPDNRVVLQCGADAPGFGRAGLAERILKDGGLWVLDFPFGPPAPVAVAAGWATWPEYLAWCEGNAGPTALRDELCGVLRDAGVRWSTRRAIDNEVGATWFPFFEQLYRQTITGARDVLLTMGKAGTGKVGIRPFDAFIDQGYGGSVVVEGFPGWTLKGCGLEAVGYKHGHRAALSQRQSIVGHLRKSGMPISDDDAERAVQDVEGDAVDALVLLLAAHKTSHRADSDWVEAHRRHGRMEGWFFD